MSNQLLRGFCSAVVGLFLGACILEAEAFPVKPIHIIVTGGPGGPLDITTRLVAEHMSRYMGEPVIVENMPSGNGLIAIRHVAKRVPADGYTLLAVSNTIVLAPAFNKAPGYDPIGDFAGIGDMQGTPLLLVGPASQPIKTLAEFIAQAKAHPGALTMANGGFGTSTHLAALLFEQQAGIKLLHASYKGTGQAMPDVIGGRLNGIFDGGITAGPQIRDGRLRAYGVSTAGRIPTFSDIPSLAEQGLPRYDFKTYLGLFAPANTPKEVVTRLGMALRSAIASDAMREQNVRGGTTAGTMSPDQFTVFIKEDSARVEQLVKALGIEKE